MFHKKGIDLVSSYLFSATMRQNIYLLDFIVYTGADTEIEMINNLVVSGSIVMTLMKPYLQKGHKLEEYTVERVSSSTDKKYYIKVWQSKTNFCWETIN